MIKVFRQFAGRPSAPFLLLGLSLLLASLSGCGSPDPNSGAAGEGSQLVTGGEFANASDALAEGTRLFDTGETEKAIEALLAAVKLDPDLAEAWFKLGVAYALIELDIDSNLETTVTPTPEPGTKKPAEKKRNSERAFESAVEAYKKLITTNSDDDVAHFYLGLTYNKLNEDEAAARSIREAVRLKPENVEYQLRLATVLMKLAKFAEAERALKKALELEPDNVEAEDLLEKAEAGRKRIDFIPPKKDEKTGASNTANANADSNTTSDNKPPTSVTNSKPSPVNSNPRSTPRPSRTPG
ncbi:MAG TPA: tetratricopeptide repeat protein [Pyrinomonadaceae bacterium]|nr:tetratricopeptide repeat protein [Pyrinomonadaceae bacterium]